MWSHLPVPPRGGSSQPGGLPWNEDGASFPGLLISSSRVGATGSSPHPMEPLPEGDFHSRPVDDTAGTLGSAGTEEEAAGMCAAQGRLLGPRAEDRRSVFLVHSGVLAVLWKNGFSEGSYTQNGIFLICIYLFIKHLLRALEMPRPDAGSAAGPGK